MKTLEGATPTQAPTRRPSVQGPRRASPIKWFAAIGAFFVVLQSYIYLRWVLSGNFTRLGSGPDPIPLWMRVAAHSAEILAFAALIWGIRRYVYRPWRTAGRVPPVGLMWLVGFTAYWMDWLIGWAAPVGNWNGAYWFNMGSWYNFIPGWVSPNGEGFRELNSFGLPAVIAFFGLMTVWLCWVLRRVQRRWPQMSLPAMLLVACGAGIVVDLILEVALIRLGLYFYGGYIPGITLFSGHYYQVPIWEPVILGTAMGLFAALVHFVDDRGQTLVERGLDRIQATDRTKSWLRFLAFTGAVNVIILTYCLVFGVFTLHPDYQWSKDIVNRSYLRGDLCGEGTDIACPAPGLPVPRRSGGLHVAPNGDVVHGGRVIGHVPLNYK